MTDINTDWATLLSEVGLTPEDFVNLRSVERGVTGGHIVVRVGPTLGYQPFFRKRDSIRLVVSFYEDGGDTYVFGPVD